MSRSRLVRGVMTLAAAAAVGGAAAATGHSNSAVAGALVFSSDRAPNLVPQLISVGASGGGRTQLTSWSGYASWISPSPDGRRVAYTLGSSLYVAQADGSAPVELTDGSAPVQRPVWSPDSSAIAFSTDLGALDVVSVSGELRQLVATTFLGEHAWSPDGSEILYGGGYFGDPEIDAVRISDAHVAPSCT